MSVCETCVKLECAADDEVSLFSLNDGYWLFSKEYIFTVSCPPGYQCANGAWPRIVKIPAKTFQLLIPRDLFTEQDDGPYGTGRQPVLRSRFPIRLNCCVSSVSYTLPAGSTLLGITNQVNLMFLQCARQQAHCVNLTLKPTPTLPTVVPCSGATTFPTVDDDGAVDQSVCIGTAINRTITVIGGYGTVEIAESGTLPTGVTATIVRRTIKLQGTPTTAGDYSYTITLTGQKKWCQNGVQQLEDHVTSFEYNYHVVGFSTASPLTSGTIGDAYSQVISFDGAAPYTFSVIDGAMPTGFTLDAVTGEIYGTPDWTDFGQTDTSKTYTFTVQCVDSDGITCSKEFEMTVNAPDLDFGDLDWSVPDTFVGSPLVCLQYVNDKVYGNQTQKPSAQVPFYIGVLADLYFVNPPGVWSGTAVVAGVAEMTYIGPKSAGNINLVINAPEPNKACYDTSYLYLQWRYADDVNWFDIKLLTDSDIDQDGSFDFPWVLVNFADSDPASGGRRVVIRLSYLCKTTAEFAITPPTPYNLTGTITLT